MGDLLIGIDCGTTALKGVLCDADGHELARAQRPIALLTPQPGWAEQDPDVVWQALCEVVRELAQIGGERVAALAIGAQAGSIIPADAHGKPIHPMITFLDTRAASYVEAWTKGGWRDEIRQITGWGLQIGQPLTSMAWLRDHRPEVFVAAERFIEPHDDLVYRLTGTLISNASCCAQMPLIDRRTGEWSTAIAESAGISVSHLPPLGPSGGVVGPILPSVADQLGLPRAVQIINGGQDHACEALALGLTDPGSLMLATGTAWVITSVADTPDIGGIPPQMDLNAHVVPDRWTISTYMGGFGAIVEWWLNAAPSSHADKYALLQQALETTQPGSSGLLFAPESQTRVASQFSGLKLSHTWADMTRAIVEGSAFEVRRMVEALRRSNLPVQALYMLGGAARNAHWRRILADLLDMPIIGCDDPYLGARGAAILAGIGAGILQPFDPSTLRQAQGSGLRAQDASAAKTWPHFAPQSRLAQPDTANQSLYDQRYVAYLELTTDD